ncbi:hypothetical protein OYC64_006787 [Pagothenia borchgrevinki]|uniref:Uncharacterized protein n=1 Tax=Pagothenia borchgrevinki TaxID=8213 RepID=A0ABD2G4A6_PAGBO
MRGDLSQSSQRLWEDGSPPSAARRNTSGSGSLRKFKPRGVRHTHASSRSKVTEPAQDTHTHTHRHSPQ